MELFILFLLALVHMSSSIPVGMLPNVSRNDIKYPEILPPDHIPGGHMEHDGDINKDYHHEAFLGTLVKQGKLKFGNMRGYHTLIDIFHRVDTSQDHMVDHAELSKWIHDRINEHYYAAKKDSDDVFARVDTDKDDSIQWAEYKALLVGMDKELFLAANVSREEDETGSFSKEAVHWRKADLNEDGKLTQEEFLSFLHPEHNQRTLETMADEMIPSFDRDHDQKISLEEFTHLPPGEVSEEEKELDRQYVEERRLEFINDMDADGDGFVDRNELIQLLDPRHKQHAAKEADYLIRVADTGKDNRISEREMLMNYKLFTGSSLTNYARLHDEF